MRYFHKLFLFKNEIQHDGGDLFFQLLKIHFRLFIIIVISDIK